MKTLQIIVSRTDDSQALLYLSTLLSSRLINFWCTDYLVDDMYQSYLEKLPIRRIAFTSPPDERLHHAGEGRQLYEQFCAKGDHAGVLAFVDHHLRHEPEQSDVVHDLLAFLAEQMIEMNQRKQAEVTGFLAWLQNQAGALVDSLSNKTRLLNYLGDYQKREPHLTFEELLDILKRNRRRLKVEPDKRAWQERLAEEYQASLDSLLPLKQRLAATDRLIDRVVYRLYGLTEEEIAIVEGSRF